MIVVVDGTTGQVVMDEAANLRGLSVELRACETSAAGTLLGDLGSVDRDHVWLDIGLLKGLSPLAHDPEWDHGFDGVMEYARSKGWIDDTGKRVRAHIQP